MTHRRPSLRDDLERVMVALDRGPHTPDELAEASGIASDHLGPRIDELLDRGWIFRWGPGDPPALALTWRGRFQLHRAPFQAAAMASLGAGLAMAAGIGAWAAWSAPASPGGGPAAGHGPGLLAGLTAASALLLLAAARLRRSSST